MAVETTIFLTIDQSRVFTTPSWLVRSQPFPLCLVAKPRRRFRHNKVVRPQQEARRFQRVLQSSAEAGGGGFDLRCVRRPVEPPPPDLNPSGELLSEFRRR